MFVAESVDVADKLYDSIEIDIDYCSIGAARRPNEDYVLLGEGMRACVADGVGGEPLGDAVARCACHAAMRALERGESTRLAVAAAQDQVMRFIADVDSPRSGTSLAVVALRGRRLEASWAGDTALFFLKRGHGPHEILSSLDSNFFGTAPPLGKGNNSQTITVSENVYNVDSVAVCTDGAWRLAGHDEIGRLLAKRGAARKTAAKIVLGRCMRDDSTALVARFHHGTQRRH